VTTELETLRAAAAAVRERAHAPYSRFKVGAALRDERGRVAAGCNVENAAYPEGVCAEAGAIAAMVASGGTRIVELIVLAHGPVPCTPCGGCRQKIREFADAATRVHVFDATGLRASYTVEELLPQSFGPGAMA
jgi:cytidine deaminase